MKNKKQLIGGALALSMIVSMSSVFAADMNASITTTMHHKKMHTSAMASTTMVKENKVEDKTDGKVDMKDLKGKDLEVKDDMKATGTEMMKTEEVRAHKSHKKHKSHKMVATSTPVVAN